MSTEELKCKKCKIGKLHILLALERDNCKVICQNCGVIY